MIIQFEEKPGKKYELQSEHANQIFDSVREDLLKIFKKYEDVDKDILISVISCACIIDETVKDIINRHGSLKIMNIVGASEILNETCTVPYPMSPEIFGKTMECV